MTSGKEVSIAAVGDIMLDRAVGSHYIDTPEDFVFTELGGVLGSYDFAFGNLENPVGVRGEPHPKQDPHVAFRCHPGAIRVLRNLNLSAVTLGNNHMLDYGQDTLADTLYYLEQAGVSCFGAGMDFEEANRPLQLTINGTPVAILASVMIYSASTEAATPNRPGVATYKPTTIIRQIRRLKQQGHIVIVTVHWGIEYCFYPIPYQREQAKKMIDAGASLVIGHGPHFPQGIERHKHGEIVHSLGNFVFDEPYPNSKRSFIYGAWIRADGFVLRHDIIPVSLKHHCPVIDPRMEKARVTTMVNALGEAYLRKSGAFWRKINNRWFSDVVWRVSSMKSFKFVVLPPISFYLSLGITGFLKKLSIRNLRWAVSLIFRRSRKA